MVHRWKVRLVLTSVVLIVLVGGLGGWYFLGRAQGAATLRTAPIKRGDVVATISATGTIEPEEVVDVGAQVAGLIKFLGKDIDGKTVDNNSRVKAGRILARIDDSLYATELTQAQGQLAGANAQLASAAAQLASANGQAAQARAQLAGARAQVAGAQAGEVRARADLGQLKAKLRQATQDWNRAQALAPNATQPNIEAALSPSQYDAYQAAYETAVANVAVGNATVEQAKYTTTQAEAAVDQAKAAASQADAVTDQAKAAADQARASIKQGQAAVDRAQRNLDYCVITSPVDGVVIARRVNVGQTVVSSLNAPSLFLIARDLTRMQVWVAVNEADIDSIREGQPATFTADSVPGRKFKGTVSKVRLDAQMTQNVVTYTVEVTTDNSDGALCPYATANVLFEVGNQNDALLVPNAALRWTPKPEQIAPEFRDKYAATGSGKDRQSSGSGGGKAKTPRTTQPASSAADADPPSGPRQQRGTVWIEQNGFVKPLTVARGLTDGTWTAVSGEGIVEGVKVVIGEEQAQAGQADNAKSPFTPQMGRSRQGGSGGGAPGGGGAGGGAPGGGAPGGGGGGGGR